MVVTTTDQDLRQEGMVVVDDIAARLHVRPATETSHRYDRTVIAAAMAEVLTRHLEPDLHVQADGTVWCHIEALSEHGFVPEEATGVIPRRAAALWEEIIVEHVDLDAVERAGQRTHVEVTAAGAFPGEVVAVSDGDAREHVNPERINPTTDERWERAYGIGAPAAIRAVASIAAPNVAAHAGQTYLVRAPVTWPPQR